MEVRVRAGGRPVEFMTTDRGSVLVIREGVRVDRQVAALLAHALRGVETRQVMARRPMTYSEAATALGVSPKWLQRRRDRIPHIPKGRGAMFLPEHVDEIRQRMIAGEL